MSAELTSLEIDMHGQGRTDLEHSAEVLAALRAAADEVAARALATSVSGDSEYAYGVDVLPTTSKGWVAASNIPAWRANTRAGTNPLKVAIGG
ncbi:MAG: hypothetical protein IKP01_02195 [Bacteroidales bacterium]|nr:hypothetical protein [Bacteroidales bacterium]